MRLFIALIATALVGSITEKIKRIWRHPSWKITEVSPTIGGMTNIVIDKFNGLMVQPNENSLYNALKQLIEDEKQRMQLAKNAYETVKSSFNINIWRDRWKNVIQNAEDGFIQNK